MGAKNKVISGAYQGYFVNAGSLGGDPHVNGAFGVDNHDINKRTVEMYELITEEKVNLHHLLYLEERLEPLY